VCFLVTSPELFPTGEGGFQTSDEVESESLSEESYDESVSSSELEIELDSHHTLHKQDLGDF
jgi:hypothetical protein